MKLFKMIVSIPIIVLAEDEEDARDVAIGEYHEIVGDAHGPMIQYSDAEHVTHVAQLPDSWSKESFPYGGPRDHDDQRIGGILHREQLAEHLADE